MYTDEGTVLAETSDFIVCFCHCHCLRINVYVMSNSSHFLDAKENSGSETRCDVGVPATVLFPMLILRILATFRHNAQRVWRPAKNAYAGSIGFLALLIWYVIAPPFYKVLFITSWCNLVPYHCLKYSTINTFLRSSRLLAQKMPATSLSSIVL